MLIDNQYLKDRILLEEIPSGQDYLADIKSLIKILHQIRILLNICTCKTIAKKMGNCLIFAAMNK